MPYVAQRITFDIPVTKRYLVPAGGNRLEEQFAQEAKRISAVLIAGKPYVVQSIEGMGELWVPYRKVGEPYRAFEAKRNTLVLDLHKAKTSVPLEAIQEAFENIQSEEELRVALESPAFNEEPYKSFKYKSIKESTQLRDIFECSYHIPTNKIAPEFAAALDAPSSGHVKDGCLYTFLKMSRAPFSTSNIISTIKQLAVNIFFSASLPTTLLFILNVSILPFNDETTPVLIALGVICAATTAISLLLLAGLALCLKCSSLDPITYRTELEPKTESAPLGCLSSLEHRYTMWGARGSVLEEKPQPEPQTSSPIRT